MKTIIKNFDQSKTFSSFLPGIAGLKGIPMWCYYVNRGQAIGSFGVENKNNAIMEFFPANLMFQNISKNGFRTFIKLDSQIYEPFEETKVNPLIERVMTIDMNAIEISEIHSEKMLKTKVQYFTIPEDQYAALSRTVTVKNMSDREMTLELLDGMPSIIPFGIDNDAYKAVGNTLRAWMDVSNVENDVPFYKVRSSTADSAVVSSVHKGHFYLAFDGMNQLIQPIMDMDVIFNHNTSLSFPEHFAHCSIKELQNKDQCFINKVSGGFGGVKITLKPMEEFKLYSLIGHIESVEALNGMRFRIASQEYIEQKRSTAIKLTQTLTDQMSTNTSHQHFDQYARQCYLDNVLRGGVPVLLGNQKKHVYHVFSRKHGDLERDYNFFSLSPEMYSQGNGNFRDTNQNRRNDVFFNPQIGTFNIKLFMNLIQLDGYNPLVVKGSMFNITDEKKLMLLLDPVPKFLKTAFTPGQLVTYLTENVQISEVDCLMNQILDLAVQNFEADFGEGFWTDHWTYNMDHIESYLMIYPDKAHQMLFEEKDYVYFNSPAKVKSRKEKYVTTENGVRQYHALHESDEDHKVTLIKDNYGKGEVYKTNLVAKLFNLAVIKFSTLDIEGIGIEMEANKPGWNDSLNGLPGLFGSGISETLELKRLMQFLLGVNSKEAVEVPVEVFNHVESVMACLKAYNHNTSSSRNFEYWNQVATLRETYRVQIYKGISGENAKYTFTEFIEILTRMLNKVDAGLEQAKGLGDGLMPTYLRYDVQINSSNPSDIIGHRVKRLPYFLEGPTKALKVMTTTLEKNDLYRRVKSSNIYDQKLKMYKVSENLNAESYEIGRARAFTPGWLENESIFLHMSYKYLLEVLKAGLYEEFYEDIKTSFVPMMDPQIYGRSTLENSSFIASSANPDHAQHGRGFIARLSGSTAEFIHIWILMMAGLHPFRMSDDQLELHFEPILHHKYFDANRTLSFRLLGHTDVTYENLSQKNTWEGVSASLIEVTSEDEVLKFKNYIPAPYAAKVREGKYSSIKIILEESSRESI